MKSYLRFLVILMLFAVGTTWAADSPVAMLQDVSNKMLLVLKQNKPRLKQPGFIPSTVRRILIPHVDLDLMSAQVVGPNYWRSATANQKQLFKEQFTKMVISTYSEALASYDDDKVLFYPFRGNADRRTVEVRSVIVRRSGQRIPLSYSLIRKNNAWFVYDFSVENISIVQSYRAQFAGVLSSSGMSGLLQRLIRHNQRGT